MTHCTKRCQILVECFFCSGSKWGKKRILRHVPGGHVVQPLCLAQLHPRDQGPLPGCCLLFLWIFSGSRAKKKSRTLYQNRGNLYTQEHRALTSSTTILVNNFYLTETWTSRWFLRWWFLRGRSILTPRDAAKLAECYFHWKVGACIILFSAVCVWFFVCSFCCVFRVCYVCRYFCCIVLSSSVSMIVVSCSFVWMCFVLAFWLAQGLFYSCAIFHPVRELGRHFQIFSCSKRETMRDARDAHITPIVCSQRQDSPSRVRPAVFAAHASSQDM